MTDVRNELLLHSRQVLQPADLVLQFTGHIVHRGRQAGQFVGALDLHPLVEIAGGDASGDLTGGAQRLGDLTGDHVADHPEADHQQHPGRHQIALQHVQGLLFGAGREDEVDGKRLSRRREQMSADDHCRLCRAVGIAHLGEGDIDTLHVGRQRLTKLIGHAVGLQATRHIAAGGRLDHHAELAGLAAHLTGQLAEPFQQ